MNSTEFGKRIGILGVLVVVALACSSSFASTNRMLSLDGSTGYVSVPDSRALRLSQTDFTLSCWLQINSYKELGNSIMEKRISGSASGWIFELQGASQGDNTAKKIIYGASQGGDPYVAGGTEVSTGTWHHVAVSFTLATSNAVLYLDGKLDGQGIVLSPISVSNSLFIGYSTLGHPYYFDGKIDDIQIWSKALTACEVRSVMEARPAGTESNLIAYWNFDNGTAADATTNGQNGAFVGGATTLADTDAVTAGVYLAIEVPFRSGSPLTRYQLQYTTDLLSGSWINVGQPLSGNGGELSLFDGPRGATPRFYRVESVYGTLSDGLVAYYPFNGNANDESGHGNNAVVYGASFGTNRFGASNTCLVVKKTDSAITTNNVNVSGGSSRTIALWFRADVEPVWPDGYLLHWGNNSSAGADQMLVYHPYHITGPDSGANIASDNGDAGLRALSNPRYLAGGWHHLAFTYNNGLTTAQLYLDGTRVTENRQLNSAVTVLNTVNTPLIINNVPSGSRGLDGALDDIRIYNRALSPAEIQQLYTLSF